MKVLILAGGLGSRLSEETSNKPKPMVEVAGKPIIWHIMKIYAHAGFKDFIILVGYQGNVFKKRFSEFVESDWNVDLLDTGQGTLKSQRIKKAEYLITEDHFFVAYGDDVSDINPQDVYNDHLKHPNRIATLTAMPLETSFGVVEINEDGSVSRFREKPKIENHWINGGFFCFSREIFSYMNDENEELEDDIFSRLSQTGKIGAYRHNGFWKCMNTMKEKKELEELVKLNQANWIKW